MSEKQVRNAHIGSAEEVVLKRTMSVSFIAGLPSDERAALERDIRALIDRTPVLREEKVSFPYETSMFAYRKKQGCLAAP